MRLGTIETPHAGSSRDGQLVVVDDDGDRYLSAEGIVPCLQAALDDWESVAPQLEQLSTQLLSPGAGHPLRAVRFRAPLPRAYEWIDGSTFLHHIRLARQARGAPVPDTLLEAPLAYQGGSGVLLGARDHFPLGDESWDLDLEGEVCVVVGDVPQGITVEQAHQTIRLVLLANDWTYRGLVPAELNRGFGFLQSKPATAFSPWAVTPGELGPLWQEARLHLPLHCSVNGQRIGRAHCSAMHFSFAELIAHVAKTRSLTAGTLIGSGTVSEPSEDAGASCLVEVRARETLVHGQPSTQYLQVGDTIRIEALTASGRSVFGAIEQSVTSANPASPTPPSLP